MHNWGKLVKPTGSCGYERTALVVTNPLVLEGIAILEASVGTQGVFWVINTLRSRLSFVPRGFCYPEFKLVVSRLSERAANKSQHWQRRLVGGQDHDLRVVTREARADLTRWVPPCRLSVLCNVAYPTLLFASCLTFAHKMKENIQLKMGLAWWTKPYVSPLLCNVAHSMFLFWLAALLLHTRQKQMVVSHDPQGIIIMYLFQNSKINGKQYNGNEQQHK